MIGPNKFSVAERKEIEAHVRSLEGELSRINDAAIDLCQRRNNRTGSYENRLNQFLQEHDLEDCLKVYLSMKPFSPYSTRVKFKDNLHVGVKEYLDQRADEILPPDQLREIRRVEAEYAVEMSRFNRESSHIIMKQETLYHSIVDLTLVEMPFKQKRVLDKVVLYVSDPYEKSLIEAKIDLRAGDYFIEPRSSHLPNVNIRRRSSSEVRHMMKFQARLNAANVYYVHNFCKDVTAQEMLFEVKTELQGKYDTSNPDAVKERFARTQAEMMKRDDVRRVMRTNLDRVAGRVLMTHSRCRKFAIVDSKGNVSPSLDLDALLDEEPWKLLIINPFDRN